ncbi:MAG: pirin family protein [Microthrixaceae bacterium]
MSDASSPVQQTVPLQGMHWPTVDPFLFCAHHLDRYPAGNGGLAPVASLAGRDIGSDFSGLDGWSMYHGSGVPGFPSHPHRGFETVTIARQGLIDHSDSLGAAARFGRGDVQWVTAGAGIVHSEMFPLTRTDGPNPTELFQIWLNLPAARKMAAPHFTMLWAEDLPVVDGDRGRITVVAGACGEVAPLDPPPESWAAEPGAEVAIWVVDLEPGGSVELPPASTDTVAEVGRVLYCFDGAVRVADTAVDDPSAVVVDPSVAVRVAASDGPATVLVLQGRPIAEPVAQYGPFVMNDEEGIRQAMVDFRTTGFGGWPWPADDPTHGDEPRRFARHPDGRVEEPAG